MGHIHCLNLIIINLRILRLDTILLSLTMHFPILQKQFYFTFDLSVARLAAYLFVREHAYCLRLFNDARVAELKRLTVEVVILSCLT